MFDLADLITLPGSGHGTCGGVSRKAAATESFFAARDDTSTAAPTYDQNNRHVIDACAMASNNVALAMSDGELCHAKLSQARVRAAKLVPTEEQRWPLWNSWPSRHGKVHSLQYDPAHDALVTIEARARSVLLLSSWVASFLIQQLRLIARQQATTAAGDQAFLGRYHRKTGSANTEREGDTNGHGGNEASGAKTSWVGCSVPLATSHAKLAVCASRGWAAVGTGSMVNLWAVARPGLEPLNAQWGASRIRQAPVGFEHALSVDLAELIGVKGGTSEEGGAKHIALHGNLLALATDHAVFLVHLSFDVKGEPTHRCGSAPANGFNAAATPSSRGVTQSPRAEGPPMYPPLSSPADKLTTSLRGPPVAPTSDGNDPPPKNASSGGPSGVGKGLAGVDEGDEGGKAKPERRDGIVERAVSEADDLVVCVLHPGEEENGREPDGSAQPPPLLRAFDDDWEAFRAQGDYSTEPPELANAPLATELFPTPLPVNGNSAVLDRVGGCEVVLARRVGPGEVVKQVHLLPIAQRNCDGVGKHDTAQQGESDRPVACFCRFVLLTSKGSTVCLVCAARGAPAERPGFQDLARPRTPGEASYSLSPSPSPSSTPSAGRWTGHLGGKRQPAGSILGSGLSAGAVDGVAAAAAAAAAGNISGGSQQVHVHLRRACRFVNDLVLASITSAFMFVLTVEGVEVWTFPPDKMPAARGKADSWLDEHAIGGAGTPRYSSPDPSPRPCLLHVQQLEIDGILPRSLTSCMVSLGGASPGLLLFPSPPINKGASLTFLAQQCRWRLRSQVPADGAIPAGVSVSRESFVPTDPFYPWPPVDDATKNVEQDCWQQKSSAWRKGFCGLGRHGASKTALASPLALFLRLRTPTEAFRRLAAAEEYAPRPFSAAVASTFESAAEGLHGALTAEAATAWHATVCSEGDHAATGLARRAENLPGPGNTAGASTVKQAEIEVVLAGLANCWRLQRVAARCASLLGRLLLEKAILTGGGDEADSCLAYTRACSWLLVSEGSVVESFARLQDVAAQLSGVGGEAERPAAAPSFASLGGDDKDERSDLATGEVSSPNLEELLRRAMYESYLLSALGVGDASESRPPPIFVRGEHLSSLDKVLSGLVGYLHGQGKRRLSRRPGLRGVGEARRGPMPLSTAIVYANRIPWTACPAALSRALLALDEQDKALAESTSTNLSSSSSSSSGSSGSASLSGRKSSTKRSEPASSARTDAERTKHPRGGAPLHNRDASEDEGTLSPAREWLSVARAILLGYSESMESGAASAAFLEHLAAPRPWAGALAADPRVLQLACERHPTLVAPAKAGAGPLARDLLAGGRAQSVVAALVTLTSFQGPEASFGSHRARELLELTEDCFSPRIDPLHALRSFGVSGRKIAARLDSLRRASLDLSGAPGFPAEARHGDGERHEQSSSGDAVDSRPGWRDDKALSAAAREFLSRRCSASLATAGPSARHQERLSQALGAPEAWQASFARNRALDRAILRFLIGAHLDDLRALENSTAGNPKDARKIPTTTGSGWGRGLTRTASARARNCRESEECSWADVIAPLLSGQVSTARGGPAEEHVDAILRLIREISWRAGGADGNFGRGGSGHSMSHEEAEEVVKEARRRLPVSESASAPPGNLIDHDEHRHVDDDTQPWGAGGEGMEARRAPWPWGPRTVPASAVGAVLALAAALPPAGKLLAGLTVVLQVGAEVIAAAKAEAAASAGAVAAASGSAGKGAAARGGLLASASPKDTAANAGEARSSVEEVSRAAERALLLYTSEHCGKDPEKWASVTEHVRNTSDGRGREEGGGLHWGGGVDDAGQKLVRALLRRCGEELGGKALVRALPESLDLMECLDEVERSLLND